MDGELEAGEVLGMGTMREDFHSNGTRPVEMERLNIWQRGVAMEWAVDLSIHAEMPS